MASGTALAQAAPLLATPVLARLYAPTQFAELGVFTALVLGLSLFVSGRYEMAIPLPASGREAQEVLVLSLFAAVLGTVLLVVASVLAAAFFADTFRSRWGVTPATILCLPLGVLAAAVSQSCSYWFTRVGQYRLVGRSRAAAGLVSAGFGIALGLLGFRSGMVVSLVLGYLVASVWLGGCLLRASSHVLVTDRRALAAAAARYRHFPLVNGPHVLVDTIRETGTLIVFGAMFGSVATGYLAQTLRVLRAPMTLVGQAVAQVYFPRASRAVSEGRSISALTRKTALGVFAVSLPVYVAAALGGARLFALVLGPEWAEAGVYARTLAPWLAFVLVVSALSMLPIVRNVQPHALVINILETTARIGVLIVAGRIYGVAGAISGMAVAGLSVTLLQLVWYARLSADTAGLAHDRRVESAESR